MNARIPTVYSWTRTLVVDRAPAPPSVVDSVDWREWLVRDDNTRFQFTAGTLHFTAYRTWQHGEWRWYATRRSRGWRHEVALGPTGEVTLTPLQQAAKILAHASLVRGSGPDKARHKAHHAVPAIVRPIAHARGTARAKPADKASRASARVDARVTPDA